MKALMIAGVLVASAGVARAGGFEVAEHGAAATGMVGAFTAKADDASAIFFNPAGLADQRGLQFYGGATLVGGQPTSSQKDGDITFVPLPTIYASYGLPHDVAIGVGAFSEWGLKINWPSDWAGRFVATNVELATVTIDPTIAWRPMKYFAIGGGVDITGGRVDLRQALNFVAAEGSARFRGNDWAVGANLGALVDVKPVQLGISWRSSFDLDFTDGALQVNAPPELSGMIGDTRATATVPIPQTIQTGLGIRPIPRLFAQAQVDWTDWSRFKTLQLNAANPMMSQTIPEDWHDGWVLRTGAEYEFDTWTIRGGLGYDWNPVPSATLGPLVPDSNRWLISAGASINVNQNVVAEFALMGVIFESRRSELAALPIEYRNSALLTGLSLRYRSAR